MDFRRGAEIRMSVETFIKEYTELKKNLAVPNRFDIYVESLLRALSRAEEKLIQFGKEHAK